MFSASELGALLLLWYFDLFFSLKYRNSGINLLLLCEEEMLQGHCVVFYHAFLLALSVSLSGFFVVVFL